MTRQQEEKKNTYQFLQNFCSTLDEISVYLSKDNPIYKMIKDSMETAFSVDAIFEKILFVRQQIEINFLIENDYSQDFYNRLKYFVFSDLSILMDMFNLFFNKLMIARKSGNLKKDEQEGIDPVSLFSASYLLLNMNLKSIKNNVNKYFNMGFKEHTALEVADDNDSVWSTDKMKYKEFSSDIMKIRQYTKNILDDSDMDNPNDKILQLQISECIKNAIRHGNQFNKDKKVKVWYEINNDYAKIIIEDEGGGFQDLEKWNEFNKKRLEYIKKQDIRNVLKYATYKTEKSMENDGGNFLFSALEYWDTGLVFSTKRNKLYAMKYFY